MHVCFYFYFFILVTTSECGTCKGIPFNEIAQCIQGRCVCVSGFIQSEPGVCTECMQDKCHPNATCRPNNQFRRTYSCHCNPGFVGDGVTMCSPSNEFQTNTTDPNYNQNNCGFGCRNRNAECNSITGKCECQTGYTGDGYNECYWNCQLCLANAQCDQENERCICPPGYYGDGKNYCEPISVQESSS